MKLYNIMRTIGIIANFIFMGFLFYEIFFVILDVFSIINLIILVPMLTNMAFYIKKEGMKIIINIIGIIANLFFLLFLIKRYLDINFYSPPYPPHLRSKNALIFLSLFFIVTLFNIIVLSVNLKRSGRRGLK